MSPAFLLAPFEEECLAVHIASLVIEDGTDGEHKEEPSSQVSSGSSGLPFHREQLFLTLLLFSLGRGCRV